jgi:thiazole synthase ThiGH ThiG subunit
MSTDLCKATQALVANGMSNLAADETDLTVTRRLAGCRSRYARPTGKRIGRRVRYGLRR